MDEFQAMTLLKEAVESARALSLPSVTVSLPILQVLIEKAERPHD